MKKLVSVVTSSRADFGLMEDLILRISQSLNLDLELIVTGSHLSKAYGNTVEEVLKAGFSNRVEISTHLEINSESDIGAAISSVIKEISEHYSERSPSLTLVLGDRYETLGVAVACAALGIPLGHIHGGEVTSGSKDDLYRHAITKLASLHFVANFQFRDRVIGMGENAEQVFVVGGLGVDSIGRIKKLPRAELELKLGICLKPAYGILTYHPDSLDPESAMSQLQILLKSIKKFPNFQFIITGANADQYGDQFNRLLRELSAHDPELVFIESLGQQNYLSLLAGAKFVVGNSSSGLLEAPSFGVPTVNVGNRQDGRPRAKSVIDVDCNENAIVEGILRALSEEFKVVIQNTVNPYGQPGASERISDILEALDFGRLLPKKFVDHNERLN